MARAFLVYLLGLNFLLSEPQTHSSFDFTAYGAPRNTLGNVEELGEGGGWDYGAWGTPERLEEDRDPGMVSSAAFPSYDPPLGPPPRLSFGLSTPLYSISPESFYSTSSPTWNTSHNIPHNRPLDALAFDSARSSGFSHLTPFPKPAEDDPSTVPLSHRTGKNGKLSFECPRCREFVASSALDSNKYRSVLVRHQEKQSCRAIWSSRTHSSSSQVSHSGSPLPGRALSLAPNPPPCPGVLLDWPDQEHFWGSYPFAQHDPKSPIQLSWIGISTMNTPTSSWRAQSCRCTGTSSSADGGSPCQACCKVPAKVLEKYISMQSEAANRTDESRSRDQLLEKLRFVSDGFHKLSQQLASAMLKLATVTRAKSRTEELVETLAQHDVTRLRQLLSQAIRDGCGVKTIIKRITNAISGSYSATGSYSERDKSLGLLVLRLGGHRLVYALQKALGLPSLSFIREHAQRVIVKPCVQAMDDATILANIEAVVLNSRSKQVGPRVGCHIAGDETAAVQAACWFRDSNVLGGLCPCNTADLDLSFATWDKASALEQLVFPTDGSTPKAHFASQLTVMTVNEHSKDQYHALPIAIAGTCGRKNAYDALKMVEQFYRVWKTSGAYIKLGWFWSIATDGDSARRKAYVWELLRYDLDLDSPLGKIMKQLDGVELKVGKHDVLPDLDWKHIIKRMSTALRSAHGVYVKGTHINVALLGRHMHRIGFAPQQVHVLLFPHDPQNVPVAIQLVHALQKIADHCKGKLNNVEWDESIAISTFAHCYGSFVEAYINPDLSLSQQVELLSKYQHMAFVLYRSDTTRFMKNQLYIDSQLCINNTLYTIAKQQVLDPTQKLYIVKLGTDGTEVLFAFGRMLGGHNPNFNIKDAGEIFSNVMEVQEIFHQHPEWYSGSRRLDIARPDAKEKVKPADWKGDVVVGHVVLVVSHRSGRGHAEIPLARAGFTDIPWARDLDTARACTFLRPIRGAGYPGIPAQGSPESFRNDDEDEDRTPLPPFNVRSEVLDKLPDHLRPSPAALNDAAEDVPERSADQILPLGLSIGSDLPNQPPADKPGILSLSELLEIADEQAKESSEDVHDLTMEQLVRDDAPIGAKRHDYMEVEGKWIHKETVVRILFNTLQRTTQSKDRLLRVRAFLAQLNGAERSGPADQSPSTDVNVGDCVATLLRCPTGTYLAIVKALSFSKLGQACKTGLHSSEMVVSSQQAHITGQVLSFVEIAGPDGDAPCWVYDGIVRLRPINSSSELDVLELTIPGTSCKVIRPPVREWTELADADSRPRWTLTHEEMSALTTVLWAQIDELDGVKTLGCCGMSVGDKYPYANEDRQSCFFVCDAKPPQCDTVRQCQQCLKDIDGAPRLDHQARHILKSLRGIAEPVPNGGSKVADIDPCGFCGRSGDPRCAVFVRLRGKTVKVISDCPDHFDVRYGDAVKSTRVRPTTNVPLVCVLCAPGENASGMLPAHWKYNFHRHIFEDHPEYATPGSRSHPARPGRTLPTDFAPVVAFGLQEEELVGVPTSIPWSQLGTAHVGATEVPHTPLGVAAAGAPARRKAGARADTNPKPPKRARTSVAPHA